MEDTCLFEQEGIALTPGLSCAKNLERLNLTNNNVPPALLAALAACKKLQVLQVADNEIGQSHAGVLASTLKSLAELQVRLRALACLAAW